MANIYNSTSNTVVIGTSGADSIYNGYRSNVTIDAGEGNDTIYNDGTNVTINGGAGNDSIYNYAGAYVTIDAGKGNDSISNYDDRVSINAGAGNDRISLRASSLWGWYVTVKAGLGNDTIYGNSLIGSGHGAIYQYTAGDGDDLIRGFTVHDTLQIGGGTGAYIKRIVGDDIILTVDEGSITLKGAASLSAVHIAGTEKTILVAGTADDDTIENSVEGAMIQALGGDDSIINNADMVEIAAGIGDDYIRNNGWYSKISLGAGENSIRNDGSYVTIHGGDGEDFIYNVGENVTISGDDGDDSISNWSANVSINGDAGNDTLRSNRYANVTLNAGTGDDLISLSSTASNNVIVYSDGDGNDLIQEFNATTTLQIGNGTDSYSKETVDDDIIISVGVGRITLQGAASLSAVNIAGTEKTANAMTLTDKNSSSVTLKSAIEIANASARTKAITITGNAKNNIIAGGKSNDQIKGGTGNDSLFGGGGSDKLLGQAGDDTLWGGAGNDTLTGGDGTDLFIYSAGKDAIVDYAEGDKVSLGAAITKATLKGSDAVLTVGSGTLTLKDVKNKRLTLIDAEGTESTTIFGGLTLTDSNSAKVTVSSSYAVADASARTKAIRLVGNALDNSLFGGGGKDTIYGSNGNDYLVGNVGNDKLYGQNGNDSLEGGYGDDTLWGGAGNDTLIGGDGTDLFIYSAGKDAIVDYAEGDKVSLGAAITKATLKGSDAVLTVGSGTLTLKDVKNKRLTLIDAEGTESTTIFGGLTLTDSNSAKVTVSSSYAVADASARTKAIRLVGNALDNSLFGGGGKDTIYGSNGNDYLVGNVGNDKLYGQNGNDTLWGGAGNDTLTGGTGSDVFIYADGEGKDVISGFDNDDMLQITGTFTGYYTASSGTVSFKVGSTYNSIVLKDYTATTFNVNGDTYAISGTKLVKQG